MAYIEIIYN